MVPSVNLRCLKDRELVGTPKTGRGIERSGGHLGLQAQNLLVDFDLSYKYK